MFLSKLKLPHTEQSRYRIFILYEGAFFLHSDFFIFVAIHMSSVSSVNGNLAFLIF